MSSPFLHPRQRAVPELDWARLIPGAPPGVQAGVKKPVRSVSSIVSEETPEARPSTIGEKIFALLPAPLRGRMAARWIRSVAADVALVGLNWLLLGALLVPLHRAFPQVRLFGYDAGRPFSLLGIAVLHAALIVLMGHIEELYAADRTRSHRVRSLCRAFPGPLPPLSGLRARCIAGRCWRGAGNSRSRTRRVTTASTCAAC